METLHQDISEACKRTDCGLWDAYVRSAWRSQTHESGAGRLIFPRDRGDALRVSEQEARFAFVEALFQGPLRYAVEAPTSKLYSFSGKTPLSAQTDLQVHGANEIGGICNVEFKAKGVSPSRNNCSIYKDVQKLLREPVWGLWFHLLESTDNSTINKFLNVMAQQLGKVQDKFGKDVEAPGLTLHVCVLRHRFSLQKDVPLPISDAELARHLRVDLHVSRSELIEERDLNGWDLIRRR